MADSPTPEKHRSFTVRVPMHRYLQLSEMAVKEGLHLNQKVNEVLALGLGEHVKLDKILGRMIKNQIHGDTSE